MIDLKSSPRRPASLVSVLLMVFGLLSAGCGSHPGSGTTTLVASIKVTADSTAINAGATTQLHAMSTSSAGTTTDVTSTVAWSSGSPTIAAVSTSGMLTGMAAGNATITASLNGVAGAYTAAVGAPGVTGLTLTPKSATVFTHGKQAYTAFASYANNTSGDATAAATWSVAPASVATVAGGVVTAVAPGSYTVTAMVGTQTATATGTVVNAPVSSVAVTPATPSLVGGTTQKFTATATYADGSTADVSSSFNWTSSNPALLTIDATGLATVIGTSGTVTVTGQFGTITAKATVTLTTAATLTALVVTPTSSSIANGTAEPHAATATYSDGSQKDVTGSVTWAVVAGTTSSVGHASDVRAQGRALVAEASALDGTSPVVSVDQTGVDSAMSPGITTVQASMGGLQSQSVVIVTAATVKSLAITSSKTLFPAGSMQPMQLIGHFSDGTTQDLSLTASWVSSDPTVATIDSKGNVTGVKPGRAQMSASFGGLSTSSGDLTVLPVNLLYVSLKAYSLGSPVGVGEQMQMIGTFSDGTTQDLTSLATWATANPNVDTIESYGFIHPVGPGTTEISGTALARTATISLATDNPKLIGMDVEPGTPSFALGTTDSFSALGAFSNGLQSDLAPVTVWTSSDPTVMTINSAGRAKAGKIGTATVTASLLGVTQTSMPVQVTGAQAWRLVVSPNSAQIAALTGLQYKAVGLFDNSTVQDLTGDVTWSTEDIAVARIDANGMLYGVKAGTTHVVCAFGSQTVRYPITVTSATLQSVAVTPANTELPLGVRRQFSLMGTFSDGTVQDLSATALWSSSTPSLVNILGQGIVFGTGTGTGSVSAQYGFLSASTSVNLTTATLTSLSLAPQDTTIRAGGSQPLTLTGTFSDGFTQVIALDDAFISSAPDVAQVLASDDTAYAVGVGTTQITASFEGKTATTNSFRVLSNVITSIAIAPPNPSLAAGNNQQFTATATYADGSTGDISGSATWVSANPAVLNLDSNGLATAYATPGVVTVMVTAASGGATASFSVSVLPAGTSAVTLTSVAVTPITASFASGSKQQFALTGTFSDGSTQDLTPSAIWTSSNVNVATISASGWAFGFTTGTVQFSGSYRGQTATTGIVTVTPGKTVAALLVKPSSSSIAAGSAEQHSAFATYSDGTQADVTGNVTWSVASAAAASAAHTGLTAQARAVRSQLGALDGGSTVATVNQAGVDTAVTPGMTMVQANLGSMQSQSVVIVTPATVTGLNIFASHSLFPAGTTQQLQLIGTFSDGSYQDLSLTANWVSSNPAVATIDRTGLATGVGAGAVTFTAGFGGLTDSTQGFQVLPLGLVSTTLNALYPAPLTGTCEQLRLIGTYVDGSTHELSSLASWSSANSKLLTVDSTGMACAVPYDAATVTVTATQISATVFGQTSVIGMATVFDPVVAVNVYPQPARFALGTRLPLEALTQVQNGVFLDLTVDASWISADPTVFTIDANGLAKSGKVGTTTVQATVLGVTGTSMPIEVTNATILRLKLVASATNQTAPTSIAAGTGMVYKAIGFFSDGSSQDISQDVVWDTTDNTTASIGSTGTVQGIKPGQVQVTASFGGQTASVPLTVSNAALLSTSLTPNNIELPIGTKRTFSFLGNFSDGSTQDLSFDAVFSTPTPSIIAFLGQGQAIGAGPGQGAVSAQRGYFTASTPVNVKLTYVTSIAMNPASSNLRLGSDEVLHAVGTFDDGYSMDLVDNAIFSSQSPQVVAVQQTGRALPIGLGSGTIAASFEGSTATANVQVLSGTLTSLDVSPANPSLLLGAVQQLTATGTYTDGTTGDVTSATTWVSSNPQLVSINSSGLATALGLLGLAGRDGLSALSNTQATSVPATASSGGQSKAFNVTVLPGTATLSSVAVSPASGSFAKGTTQQFTLTGTYSDGTTQDLTSSATWTTSNGAVATISSGGLATGAGIGAVQLTGSYNGKTSSTGTVNVTAATLASIAVTPSSPSFAKGTTTQLTVTGTYTDGTTADLTGSSSYASSNQAVVSVTSGGLAAGVGTGSAQITIMSGGKTVTTGAVTVTSATLSTVAVSPATASFAKGTTQQFVLTGTFSDGTTQDLTTSATWTTSAASVATISSGGLATGAGIGAVQLTGSYNGKTSSTGTVNVTAATLASIAVTPSSPSFAKGTTQQLTVTGTYTDGTTQDLTGSSTYVSSNQAVVSVTSGGLATGVGTGSAQVTIMSGGKTVTTGTVQVTPATLTAITVNPTSAHAAAGTTVQLTVTGTYTDNSTADVTSSASWTSSTPSTATVSATGLVTGVTAGLASVTATIGTLTNTGVVRIGAATLTSVAISPSGASFAAGASQKFTLTGTFSDGSMQDLSSSATWTTSDATVATVSSTGLATGVAAGSVQFTASYGGMTATTPTVSVQPATLVSIAVTPASPNFAKGTTQQFAVTGTYSDGSTRDLTGSATFSSSNPAVVSIGNGGLGQGLATGSVQITVTAGGQTATTQTVTVTPATLTSVAITPNSPSLAAGTSQQFTATGTFSDGTTQDLSSQVVWTSSNPQVMTIGQLGLASTFQTGSVQVSATINGTTVSTAVISVSAATLVSIALNPTTAQIAKGTVRQFAATGTYTDGTTQNVSSMVMWTTSDGTVVSIDGNGLATGTGIGSATLTASLQGKTASTNSFTVTAATLISIAFTPAHPTVAAGSSSQIVVTGTYSDGSTQDLSSTAMYSSSSTGVATIGSTGVIMGVAPGTSTVTVTASGVTNSFNVSVSSATLMSIAITPANPAAFAKGTTQQFTATGTYSDGTTQDLSQSATWTSSNAGVFTIDRNGLATGTGVGSAQLTAAYQGQTAMTGMFQVSAATVSSLAITPGNASFAVGSTQQYTATATYSDNTTADVSGSATWSSSNSGLLSINSTGFATGMAAGRAMVQAQYQGLAGSVNVSVTAAAATLQQIVVSSVTSGSTGTVGGTRQYSATAVYSDMSTLDVTMQAAWSTANTAIATVNSTGLASFVAAGTTSVQAQYSGLSGSASITVAASTVLQSIAITPSAASVAKGLTQQFTATATYSDGSTRDVTAMANWLSSNTAYATINASGLATSTTGGQTQISASYQGQTAQVMLTVSAATLTSLALTPSSINLADGTKQQIIATGTLSDGSTQDFTTSVTWSSSNTNNATVNASGFVSTLGVGSVTITAQAGSINASASVTVTAASATSVQLTPSSVTIPAGGVQQLQATAMFTDGTSQDVTNSVTYTTSNGGVVTVDANGKLHGVGTGTATVTATFGSASTTTTVNITMVALNSLAIAPANLTLADGLSQQLTATGTFADGSTQNLTNTVTWMSSNPQVASVSTTGKVTVMGIGAVTITATTDNISATDQVTGTAAAVSAISVTPATTTLAAGQTQQYAATATFTDGSQQTVTSSANWSVSDPTKGSISNSGSTKGFLTTTTAGTLNVVATINGTSGTVPVTVQAAALTVLRITPSPVSTPAGTTQVLTVTGSYTDGSTANVTASTVWTSGSASVATVDATGVLHAIMAGSTTVQATVGSTSTTAPVTVSAAALNSIAITPATTSLAKGLTQQLTATGTYTDGSTANITSQVAWSSSAPSVATVSSTGLMSTLATGNSTLTATLNGISQTASVTVTPAVLQSIAVTASQNSFALGQSLQLTATGTYSDGTTQILTNSATWTSSAPAVGMVSASGLATGRTTGAFTARAAVGSVSGSLPVAVTAAVLTSIAVTPANQIIVNLGTTQFTATGTFSDGTTQNLTNSVHWALSGPVNVGTISSTGQLSGVNVGVAGTVTATLGTISGSTGFTVVGL